MAKTRTPCTETAPETETVSVEEMAKTLGVSTDTVIFCAERGDFEAERDEEGNITAIKL